ncbi:hypothetical protein ACQE98_00715 [Ornithinimicrobium sp. W1679]|uniref:hypothetical protein n=1 Tax=Ornithinimicrobium sp. W1679 TaxID=3418770 RepID=UPI003CE6D14F
MEDLVGRWSGTAFQHKAATWADEVLAARGLVRSGPLVPEKIRFWSAVFVVPLRDDTGPGETGPGEAWPHGRGPARAWLKVGNPGQAFEGRLLEALGRVVPDRVVTPWAVDDDHCWWLLPDGGPTLDRTRPQDWVDLIGDVADLQRACARSCRRPGTSPSPWPSASPSPGWPLDMVPELSADGAAGWIARTVDRLAVLPAADPQHLDPGRARWMSRRLARFEEQMALLAATGLPETLQPNDAHPRNAVGPSSPGGPVRVFDLGDSVRSHPWAVLHTTVRLAAGVRLTGPRSDTPLTRRIVDAYVERWPEVARPDRPEVLDAADRLGAVHRAASWLRLLAPVDPDRLGVPTPRITAWIQLALA